MERRLLALGLFRPYLWQELVAKNPAPLFQDPVLRTLYERGVLAYAEPHLNQASAQADRLLPPPSNLTSDEASTYEALAFLAEREFQELSRQALVGELKSLHEYLCTLAKARQRKELEEAMRDAERVGDATLIAELTRRFSELS